MHSSGDECLLCDRENCRVSARSLCEHCEDEFLRVMSSVRCALNGAECQTPATCLMEKKCAQIRASVQIVNTGLPARIPGDAHTDLDGNYRRGILETESESESD